MPDVILYLGAEAITCYGMSAEIPAMKRADSVEFRVRIVESHDFYPEAHLIDKSNGLKHPEAEHLCGPRNV